MPRTLATVPPVFQCSSSVSRNRAFRTAGDAGDAAAILVASLAIQQGDRLVVEVGIRDHSTGTQANATVVFGDNHADDLLEGDSSSSTALNPWMEFSHDFFNAGGGGGGGLPSSWSHADVGPVAVAGSASHSGATFTVAGAGADIWGTGDEFQYVYRQLTGDGQIVARVPSVEYVHEWTKAGVMMRETLTRAPSTPTCSSAPIGGWRSSGGRVPGARRRARTAGRPRRRSGCG